jgi:hypothetical protein
VVLPETLYIIGLFVIYSRLVGEIDRFHLLLIGGATVFLVLPAVLVIRGVALPVCLLALTLAPVVSVIGYERVGHARQAEVIRRLQDAAGDRATETGER